VSKRRQQEHRPGRPPAEEKASQTPKKTPARPPAPTNLVPLHSGSDKPTKTKK